MLTARLYGDVQHFGPGGNQWIYRHERSLIHTTGCFKGHLGIFPDVFVVFTGSRTVPVCDRGDQNRYYWQNSCFH